MFDKLMDRIGWSAHASRRGVAMIQPDLTWVSFSVSLAGDVCFAARLLFIQIFYCFQFLASMKTLRFVRSFKE